jgi:hypothetical protein
MGSPAVQAALSFFRFSHDSFLFNGFSRGGGEERRKGKVYGDF